jgi:hypothetical protein
VNGGVFDLMPDRGAQVGAAKSNIVQHAIVECFHAEQLGPIAKVAMNRPEQSGEQHGDVSQGSSADRALGGIAARCSFELS